MSKNRYAILSSDPTSPRRRRGGGWCARGTAVDGEKEVVGSRRREVAAMKAVAPAVVDPREVWRQAGDGLLGGCGGGRAK